MYANKLKAVTELGRILIPASELERVRLQRISSPAVTTRTTKIDDRLARIKSTAIKFQAIVEQKEQRMADLSRTVLLTINLLVLSLTTLFLVGAAGQVLLICVCWQYVRSGRFTLLHGVSRE